MLHFKCILPAIVRGNENKMQKGFIPKGFTLVELLIVLALMAIMTSFAIPAWQHYSENTNLKTATRAITADIIQTRQRAIAENVNTYQMTFNTGSNTYSLSRSDTGETLWTKKLTDFGKKNILYYGYFMGGGSALSFQRRGTMSQGWIIVRNSFWSYSVISVQLIGRPYVQYHLEK